MSATGIGQIQLAGLASGIDTNALISKIIAVEQIPVTHLQQQQTVLSAQDSAVSAIQTSLTNLQNTLTNLSDPAFFNSNVATTSNSAIATATATSSAAKSTYTIAISSLASAGNLQSGTSLGPAGQKISNTITAGDLLTANDSYGTSLTLGTFTVNGQTITIGSSDTLTSTLAQINTATSGNVTGTYNAATDTITLSAASGNLVLGSSADTSNFLSRSRLYTNGTNSVTSLTSVGNIDTTQVMNTAASRIGAYSSLTAGTFTVNGVSISVDPTVDTLQNVLDRITASNANVYASYDSVEDRIVLTSKVTGSTGITVADGTSNFASSMKLTSSTSQVTAGTDTKFTVDNGVTRVSPDLTINDVESGINGVTINANQANSTFTLSVGVDSTTIQSAVTAFVNQYNSLQNVITSYTGTPPTGADPTDPRYILSNDSLVTSLPTSLRTLVNAAPGTGTYRMLADLGITSDSANNLLTISDSSALSSALATNLNDVISMFTNSTSGIMNTVNTFLNTQLDPTVGSFPTRLANDTTKSQGLTDSITNLNNQITSDQNRLITEFTAMEQAAAINSSITSLLSGSTSLPSSATNPTTNTSGSGA